jgi:DNA modification methylase
MSEWRVICGDVRESLSTVEAGSVQACVTSPPYWGLRDYGHDGQIGLEATPDAYVAQLVAVFREVRRVLRDDGTIWINLGDSYSASVSGSVGQRGAAARQSHIDGGSGRAMDKSKIAGIKPKDLVGIPWRVAFAFQADGWYLRSDIIWSKPNPMPESVTDRPTKAHEYIFLLSKSARYYYDAGAIMESVSAETSWKALGRYDARDKACRDGQTTNGSGRSTLRVGDMQSTRNKRSVWHVATQPYAEAHFATFPEDLIRPCILAGSRPGDLVLDPFAGSGTTGAVSVRNNRDFIGCELNPAYVELARKRIGAVAPLFSTERTA